MTHVSVHHDDIRGASWSAIFAGVVTVMAVSFTLSLLTTSLGIGQVDAHSDKPLDGVAGTFGMVSALALLVSLAAGGFVAGRLATRSGFTHGLLTWAVSLFVAVLLGTAAISAAVRVSAAAFGVVAFGAGSAVSAVGSSVSTVAGAINKELIEDFDLAPTRDELKKILRDTDIDALQPERLENVIAEARRDIVAAGRELAFNPGDFPNIVESLGGELKKHAEDIAQDIDRDEVVSALADTGMTRAEAEQTADNAIEIYVKARDAIVDRVNDADKLIERARDYLARLEQEAREQADAAAAAASRAAFWTFIAAVLGALVTAFAGLAGARSRDRYHFT